MDRADSRWALGQSYRKRHFPSIIHFVWPATLCSARFFTSLTNISSTASLLSTEALRASAQNTLSKLRGTHPIDVFEPARMDQANYPLEDVMRSLKTLQEEGLFNGVGLSEVSGETVRRAAKVGFNLVVIEEGRKERRVD